LSEILTNDERARLLNDPILLLLAGRLPLRIVDCSGTMITAVVRARSAGARLRRVR
jgi:hypothetical protein